MLVEPTALQDVWLTQLTPDSDATVDAAAGLGVTVSEEPFQVSMSGEVGGPRPGFEDEPTTTQKEEPAQDTEVNGLPSVPGPLAGTFVQPLPFHVSARGLGLGAPPDWPTARQKVALTQATEFSWFSPTTRVGGCAICHEDPFQISASGVEVAKPEDDSEPTATHHVALRHETPLNRAELPVGSAEAAVIVHVVPFQVSTSPSEAPDPTATQNVGSAHDTPVRTPGFASAGVLVTVHDVPSQLSANGMPDMPWRPTATQYEAVGHDTELTLSAVGFPAVGAVTAAQFSGTTVGGTVVPLVAGVPAKAVAPRVPARPSTTAMNTLRIVSSHTTTRLSGWENYARCGMSV
jgi:hypothetical protein